MKTRKKLEFSVELIQQSVHDDAHNRDSIFKHKKVFFLNTKLFFTLVLPDPSYLGQLEYAFLFASTNTNNVWKRRQARNPEVQDKTS